MPSPLVEKLLDKNFSEQSLLEFEEDFHPSSEGLWNKSKEIAESKFGFPSSKGLDHAIKWFNLKEGYWITYLTDEELEEFFQMEDDDLTEGTLHHWFKGSKSKDGKAGWVQADGSPCANEKGETKTPKCFSSGRLASLKRKGKKGEGLIKSAVRRKREEDPGQQSKSGGAKPTNVKTFAKGKKDKDYVKAEPKLKKEEVEIQEKKDQKSSGSGTKDACYHKVKARYSVWPSAYASGALVKCRKKGASNWGNSTKKEEVEHVDEACWKGYEKKGTKKMFGKTYNNCVKKEEVDLEESTRIPLQNGNVYMVTFNWKGRFMAMKIFFPEVKRPSKSQVQDALNKVYPGCIVKRYDISDIQPGETHLNMGIGEESQFIEEMEKRYCPKCEKVETRSECKYGVDYWDKFAIKNFKEAIEEIEETSAWTRSAGKNKKGGLNEKGRKSYERENPGSDLKRPSKKVGNPRRKSFCARMNGMKKKLTSSKTANDPNSRINKSLRAWNC